MKRFLLILGLACMLPLMVQAAPTAVTPVVAEPGKPILIVDVKRILDESKASVNVQKKIEAQRADFQTEIAAKEKLIRQAEQELVSSRGKLDAAAYAEKENQLRAKFREVEQYVQERRRLLEQATTLSMGKVRSVLLGIVTEMARSRGAQAVLIRQQVLWSESALDITDEVLQRLNVDLPDVPVNIETPKEPAAAPKKAPVKAR
jgi:Skp family chaperone for outer membrane proteins